MSFDALSLAGRKALVTGGSTGIGLETARLLAARGAEVMITGRDAARLDAAAEAVPGLSPLVNDAAGEGAAEALAAAVRERLGRLDVLVLNAGLTPFAPLADYGPEAVDRLLDANLRGPWLQLRALDPVLAEGASIVAIGSMAGIKAGPVNALYGGGKAALARVMQALAPHFGPRGIRVNTVSPGPIDTPAWSKTGLPDEVVAHIRTSRSAASPLGRFGRPKEVAEVVAFLAAPAAGFVNGAEILVDGGLLAA